MGSAKVGNPYPQQSFLVCGVDRRLWVKLRRSAAAANTASQPPTAQMFANTPAQPVSARGGPAVADADDTRFRQREGVSVRPNRVASRCCRAARARNGAGNGNRWLNGFLASSRGGT